MVDINKWNNFLSRQGARSAYELCSLAPSELWRWEWGRHWSCTQGVIRVLLCVVPMIIMERDDCFSNYRCCETTVKATVCSWLLGGTGVIECRAQQINDTVVATWQLVLITTGNGGLLHIVCKHRYDLMKWSQFSHFTAKSLKENECSICSRFLSHTVGKSSSNENNIESRGCPRDVTPINIVIFHVWIVLNLWWLQTSPKNSVVCPVLSFFWGLSHDFFSQGQSFCQHFISSCSMYWKFKASVSPSSSVAMFFC